MKKELFKKSNLGTGLVASVQPYKYTGKELDRENGLNWYDFHARMYDPTTVHTTTLDPLAEKYLSMSPYLWCGGNPVRFVDPTGMSVHADEFSIKNICYTLTEDEAKYVCFDSNGVLDTKKLNMSKSTSENMVALKTLANSDIIYSFLISDKDHSGTSYFDDSAIGGTTEMPNAVSNPSPDKEVYCIIGNLLDERQQVITTAHEGYGHAYLYEITRDVNSASHTYRSEGRMIWDDEFQINSLETVKVPTNHFLEKQIEITTKQAGINYDKRKHK